MWVNGIDLLLDRSIDGEAAARLHDDAFQPIDRPHQDTHAHNTHTNSLTFIAHILSSRPQQQPPCPLARRQGHPERHQQQEPSRRRQASSWWWECSPPPSLSTRARRPPRFGRHARSSSTCSCGNDEEGILLECSTLRCAARRCVRCQHLHAFECIDFRRRKAEATTLTRR